MGQAIGGSLALAIGVALSPVPVIAVVLMLTTRQARANGPLFVLGWLAGLAVIGAIVLSISGSAGASSSGSPATWLSWVKFVLGLLLLLVAVRQFRGRPKDGEQAPLPKWMAKVDDIKPLAACGLAALLVGVNPKNLLLAVGGAAAIAQTGISAGDQAIAYLVFALVGTLGVGIPVVLYFALGPRADKLLAGLKDWMSEHNAVIMSVLCLVIGVKLIGDAISGLTS
ncbi:MAG TPA: GAP family protein [Trebonia sp.]|jgi:threonine/homoserine/homoserine lactone efflux protein|nr:GAP family protein [Trebonia sp.]